MTIWGWLFIMTVFVIGIYGFAPILTSPCPGVVSRLFLYLFLGIHSESSTSPCLWVGTSLGSVLVISLNLPEGEARKTQPVIVSPSGKLQLTTHHQVSGLKNFIRCYMLIIYGTLRENCYWLNSFFTIIAGTIFRLKGAIMCMSFLDCNGILIPQITEAWKEQPETPTGSSRKQYTSQYYYYHLTVTTHCDTVEPVR